MSLAELLGVSTLNNEIDYGLAGMKILIYGNNTLGKTPQAMNFPKPLLLMGESGGSAIKGNKLPVPDKKTFLNITNKLINEKTLAKMQEEVNTIVIDCIEDIVGLYETAICREYDVKDVGQIQGLQKGNPNGYAVYRRDFKQQINKLTQVGYTVIFISHEENEVLEKDGDGNALKEWIVPKGSVGTKGSCRFIRDLCDYRLYIKSNGFDKELNKPIMSTAWCVQTDEFYAGSRYEMPSYVNPFTAQGLIDAIIEGQKKTAENQNGILKEFKLDTNKFKKDDYINAIKPYYKKLKNLYSMDVADIVESQLGEGALVSEATEEQLNELDIIYTNLIQLACDKGVVVEVL